jgi:hypothetical protein
MTEGGMTRLRLMMGVAAIATFVTNSALANQPSQYKLGADITVEQAASMLHYSGGNDRMRVEIAPNYSEELGFSLKGAVGSYLTDAMALGLIVEYGEHKREYRGGSVCLNSRRGLLKWTSASVMLPPSRRTAG